MNIDNVSVPNGGTNETGTLVTPGTTLSGSVSINGVSGNGGGASVTCNDNLDGQFFSHTFTSNGYQTFNYTPSTGQHSMTCTAQHYGNYANGSATTGAALIPVEYVTVADPLYQVSSTLYATPGNSSSDSFTNTTSNGTTTSIGNSFQHGRTATSSFG